MNEAVAEVVASPQETPLAPRGVEGGFGEDLVDGFGHGVLRRLTVPQGPNKDSAGP